VRLAPGSRGQSKGKTEKQARKIRFQHSVFGTVLKLCRTGSVAAHRGQHGAAPALLALAPHPAVLADGAAPALLARAPHPAVLADGAAPALLRGLQAQSTYGITQHAHYALKFQVHSIMHEI
jgi:hypothetical protein